MALITIITKAYNTGDKIYRCVDSVLNQSFHDFIYVIIDNASEDGTKEVLEEYAQKDTRVHVYRNEENNVSYLYAIKTYVQTEYYMILDHDDWLEPNAIECLLHSSKTHNADMVFGRTSMRKENGDLIDVWGIDEKLVLKKDELALHFDYMYWQMRTLWGILIKSSLLEKIDENKINEVRKGEYAVDTVTTMSLVFNSDTVVFLPETIHNYLIHSGSESGIYRRNQFIANWKIMDVAKEYLKQYGEINPKNLIFLNRVYSEAICDTLTNARANKVDFAILITIFQEIICDSHTKEMVALSQFFSQSEKKRFLTLFGDVAFESVRASIDIGWKPLICWFELIYPAIAEQPTDLKAMLAEDSASLKLLCNGEFDEFQVRLWKFKGSYTPEFYDLFLIRKNQTPTELAEQLLWLFMKSNSSTEYEISLAGQLAKQNLITQKYSDGFIEAECVLVLMICANRLADALEECITQIESGSRGKDILDLALSLAAIEKQPQVFVAVRKLQFIEAYNANNENEAEELINDLLQMCPEDEEVKAWSLLVSNR